MYFIQYTKLPSHIRITSRHISLCLLVCCALLCLPTVGLSKEGAINFNEPERVIRPTGKMHLCVVENNPPFAFRNGDNELQGFNVDMWNAMNIPYTFTYRHPDFPTALAAIEGGYCHMLLTNINITPERIQRFALSEPYLRSSIGVMVRGSETTITELQHLRDKTIGVLKGSTAETFAMNEFKSGELLALSSENQLYEALIDQNIEAILADLPIIQYFSTIGGKASVRILDESLTPQLYAYGFTKGAENIRDSVNAAIQRLHADGTIARLYKKWFGVSMTAAQSTHPVSSPAPN